ncbi:MAG: GNAT family N-acetyltransferase [Acetobacteraceae bacterium]|nr:GNAT family N-acetyltransferase [Acetobacteraceae bacterium]
MTARLIPLDGPALPAMCDAALDGEELDRTRVWWDATLAEAVPAGWRPVLAEAGGAVLPLLRRGRRLRSFTTPYSLAWGAWGRRDPEAGAALGRLFALRPPVLLEAVGAAPVAASFAAGRLRALAFRQFGRWHEALAPGLGFEGWLAARPAAHRNTIRRKLARAGRDTRFELHATPGPALEAAIAGFEAVRAASWKPPEPAPRFDAALMRGFAASGALRLGLLRRAADGRAVAAQYWLLDRGGRRATIPKLFHDERARELSPGTVLTARMIRHLLEEDGVTELDFGRGDDPYKRLWVREREQVMGVVLADPLHPLGALAILRHRAAAWRRATLAAPGRSEAEAMPGTA